MKQLALNQFDLQKIKLSGKRGLEVFWYALGNNNDLFAELPVDQRGIEDEEEESQPQEVVKKAPKGRRNPVGAGLNVA